MTETKKQGRKAETIEDLGASIERMEAELAEGYGKPLTWEEVTSTTAEEVARKEQRRGILPRLIHAAKVRRIELEIARLEAEAEALGAVRGESHRKLEKAIDKENRAKEEREAARGAWATTLGAVQGLEQRIRRLKRELRELREEA
jgi:response regulator of citrate/malate metabolism